MDVIVIGTYEFAIGTSVNPGKQESLYQYLALIALPHYDIALLLFAIKKATLPFWAEIKNLRTRHCKPHKIANPGRINTIVSDLERYDIGLLEYVKI